MRRSWTSHWLNDVLPAIMLSLPLSLPLHRSDDERCEEIKRLLAENPIVKSHFPGDTFCFLLA
jgi:hypothetical protein